MSSFQWTQDFANWSRKGWVMAKKRQKMRSVCLRFGKPYVSYLSVCLFICHVIHVICPTKHAIIPLSLDSVCVSLEEYYTGTCYNSVCEKHVTAFHAATTSNHPSILSQPPHLHQVKHVCWYRTAPTHSRESTDQPYSITILPLWSSREPTSNWTCGILLVSDISGIILPSGNLLNAVIM